MRLYVGSTMSLANSRLSHYIATKYTIRPNFGTSITTLHVSRLHMFMALFFCFAHIAVYFGNLRCAASC